MTNLPNRIHRVVRRLVLRTKEHVPVETVLCDREFNLMWMFQTLSNLDVNYLIPKRMTSSEQAVIETVEADGQAVTVESAWNYRILRNTTSEDDFDACLSSEVLELESDVRENCL